MRYFEKIGFDQFKKDITDDIKLYNNYGLPKRATKKSAAYDFYAITPFTIKPGEIKKIPTGYKVNCMDDEMLLIVVRSSMGFKYNVRLCNQVGVIDSDYYNNPSNEGHIWIALQNEGKEDYIVDENMVYAQGIFTKYLLTIDDDAYKTREGGLGSTDGRGK